MSRGPVADLVRLSPTARRALIGCALLAAASAVALVVQAWALANALAAIMALGGPGGGSASGGGPAFPAGGLASPADGASPADRLASLAGGPVGGWLVVLAAAVVARAGLSWATQVVAAQAAAGAKAELRSALLDRSLALGPEWIARRGA
ncbi:MAG: hypothetical protein ACRDT4_07100, partial [Micromonosporaceae bacterium]